MVTIHSKNQQKRSYLCDLLDRGKVLIQVNPAVAGVELPPHLMDDDSVPLFLSYRFNNDIFELGLSGIRVDLSFSGERFLCVLPWPSIFYLSLADDPEEGVFFFEDLPRAFHDTPLGRRLVGILRAEVEESIGAGEHERALSTREEGRAAQPWNLEEEQGDTLEGGRRERPFIDTLDRISRDPSEAQGNIKDSAEILAILERSWALKEEERKQAAAEEEGEAHAAWRAQLKNYRRNEADVFPRESADSEEICFEDYVRRREERRALRERVRRAGEVSLSETAEPIAEGEAASEQTPAAEVKSTSEGTLTAEGGTASGTDPEES